MIEDEDLYDVPIKNITPEMFLKSFKNNPQIAFNFLKDSNELNEIYPDIIEESYNDNLEKIKTVCENL